LVEVPSVFIYSPSYQKILPIARREEAQARKKIIVEAQRNLIGWLAGSLYLMNKGEGNGKNRIDHEV
jgi:hypothetical protein